MTASSLVKFLEKYMRRISFSLNLWATRLQLLHRHFSRTLTTVFRVALFKTSLSALLDWIPLKLLLALPTTNVIIERSFSAMKRIKTYLRNTIIGNRLNHWMLLHVHWKKADQLNMIEIAKEFVGDNEARLRTFGRF